MDCVKGTSGESLRVMMLRLASGWTMVSSRGMGSASSCCQPSSTASTIDDSNRPAGLLTAPRPTRMPCSAEVLPWMAMGIPYCVYNQYCKRPGEILSGPFGKLLQRAQIGKQLHPQQRHSHRHGTTHQHGSNGTPPRR